MSGLSQRLGPLPVVGSIITMATVALAQPLLDLLGRNAPFLVAHNVTPLDVVALAVGAAVLVPAGIGLVVLILRRLHVGAATTVHAVVVTLLGAVLVLVVANRSGIAGRLPPAAVIVGALALGACIPLLYHSSAPARRALAVAAVSAPLVVALFLFGSPARALVFPNAAQSRLTLPADAPPVVFVVFDELPVASLLDSGGLVDVRAFPAFARLAQTSSFFRNATTVAQQTSDAVPAALTGRYADLRELPVAADHPDNLIALLADRYALHIEEPLTQLCPPSRCRQREPDAQRYSRLRRDLQAVVGHLVLPPQLAQSLPPVTQGWRDFTAPAPADKEADIARRFHQARAEDPAAVFRRFTAEIDATPRPTLHYIHTLLPHHPFRYLADGRVYTDQQEVAGMIRGLWRGDPWAVVHSYQRHLIQTQLADRLLGELLAKLDDEGLFDRSLIVVMADHGITFTHGMSMRRLSEETFGEIATVPLFVKLPGQVDGTVRDDPVELIDIAPTVIEAIGGAPRAGLDGVSLLDGSVNRRVKRFDVLDGTHRVAADGAEKWPVIARKNEWFPHGGTFPSLYNVAPEGRTDLLGQRLPRHPPAPVAGVTVALRGAEAWNAVDLDASVLPVLVEGEPSAPLPGSRPIVAVGVNGQVAAVTLSEATPERTIRALLPPTLLREGRNDITLWLVDRDALVPLEVAAAPAGDR